MIWPSSSPTRSLPVFWPTWNQRAKKLKPGRLLDLSHADPSQVGLWIGNVDTAKGKLPVRVQISGDDHMKIGFDNGGMVAVEDLGIEQGFLTGGAAASLGLPETGNQPSKVQLQLLWDDGNRLIGTARLESTGDRPHFGLPLYISLSRQK